MHRQCLVYSAVSFSITTSAGVAAAATLPQPVGGGGGSPVTAAAVPAPRAAAVMVTSDANEGRPLYGSWAGVELGSWNAFTTRIYTHIVRVGRAM